MAIPLYYYEEKVCCTKSDWSDYDENRVSTTFTPYHLLTSTTLDYYGISQRNYICDFNYGYRCGSRSRYGCSTHYVQDVFGINNYLERNENTWHQASTMNTTGEDSCRNYSNNMCKTVQFDESFYCRAF